MPRGVRWSLHGGVGAVLGVALLLGLTLGRPGGELGVLGKALGAPPLATWLGTAADAAGQTVCQPQGPDGFSRCDFTAADGGTLRYLLHVPAASLPQARYPLVLVLHGGAERCKPELSHAQGQDELAAASYVKPWGEGLGSPGIQDRWPSFVVVPQLEYPNRWVDVLPAKGSHELAAQPTPELRMAKDILDLLQRQYTNIDPTRRYITGISLGGYGTWDALERWPNYFAAAVPVAGGGDPSQAGELRNLPIWVFHGEDDPTVPVAGSRDMVAALRAAGGQPLYTEYVAAPHDIWARVYHLDANQPQNSIFAWLFAQRRARNQ